MYSIYHFFKTLVDNKRQFRNISKLEDLPYDDSLLSCRNKGQFPDMAIRVNSQNELFTGGELIELKDNNTYTVSSFNSTIPTQKKEISKLIGGRKSKIKQQMLNKGDDINSLPVRDVYYLIRGKKQGNIKVLLVHGSFFETIQTSDLISQSFSHVLEERIQQSGLRINDEEKEALIKIFSEQESFSKERTVDRASIKLRFRIMTRVSKEANILDSIKYPEIADNTISFVVPYQTEPDKANIKRRMSAVFGEEQLNAFRCLELRHHFNGYFLVFQKDLL